MKLFDTNRYSSSFWRFVGVLRKIVSLNVTVPPLEVMGESESRLKAITSSAQDAILMMNPQGKISYWNPAAERILGYRCEEALSRDLHRLIAPVRYHKAYSSAFPEFLR